MGKHDSENNLKMVSFSSPPASSESSSTRDSAVAISGADSRGILEEPLPSTSSEEEDPLAGEFHVCSGHAGGMFRLLIALGMEMPTS